MAGLAGLNGWQWIFVSLIAIRWLKLIYLSQIMMGILTCVSAMLGFLFVPNLPVKATFLSSAEHDMIKQRIEEDRGDFEEEPMTVKTALQHLLRLRIWA